MPRPFALVRLDDLSQSNSLTSCFLSQVKFISYERDNETGLDFAQARYFSSTQGRFLSPDAVAGSQLNPQTLNLYAYVQNNPLAFTDPTGHLAQKAGGESLLSPDDRSGCFGGRALRCGQEQQPPPSGGSLGPLSMPIIDSGEDPPPPLINESITITASADNAISLTPGLDRVYDLNGNPVGGLLRLSDAGLRFLAGWEGWVPRLYNDAAGHCTIGYGHLLHLGGCGGADRRRYPADITQDEGLGLLRDDVGIAEGAVRDNVQVPLDQNQFDALVSFTFNIGTGGFRRSSALTQLNQGNYDEVPNRMGRWNTAGGRVLRGLTRRRRAEGRLFSGQ